MAIAAAGGADGPAIRLRDGGAVVARFVTEFDAEEIIAEAPPEETA